eukprot:TRINITY_DN4512_c0_g1_i1.p1 TRINITY_DN4512_c0_g1~~TRINITY_DN4512_c0_g1_i1.p1  ORF type:complete len:190 (-),score=53.37 TRINITY_DN4512_c0_g1_i1:29-568(-)
MDKLTFRHKESKREDDELELLDEQDQIAFIESLSEKNRRMKVGWEWTFFSISAFMAFIKLVSMINPFLLPIHSEMEEEIPITFIRLFELVSFLFFLASGAYIKPESKWKNDNVIYGAFGISLFMIMISLSLHEKFLHSLWLFGINVIVAAFAMWANYSFSSTDKDITNLHKYRYNLKTI